MPSSPKTKGKIFVEKSPGKSKDKEIPRELIERAYSESIMQRNETSDVRIKQRGETKV